MSGIAGMILAGERSLRMEGGDKCLCRLAGRPIWRHVTFRLSLQTETHAIGADGGRSRFEERILTELTT